MAVGGWVQIVASDSGNGEVLRYMYGAVSNLVRRRCLTGHISV